MKSEEVSRKLGVSPEYVRKSKGIFRYHVSYFYGIIKDAQSLINKVLLTFPEAEIIDSGNHWHKFVGGAKSGSAKDSFLWVKFKILEK